MAVVHNASGLASAIINSTSSFRIGRSTGTFDIQARDIIDRVRFWKARFDFSDEEILAMWNSGDGHYHTAGPGRAPGTLTSIPGITTNLKLSIDGNESSSGTRSDSSGLGHHMSEVGGTVEAVPIVTRKTDRSGSALVQKPVQYSASADYTKTGFCAGPRWIAESAINGRPALELIWNHYLYAAAAQPFDFVAADFFEVVFVTGAVPPTEIFKLISADEATEDFYFMTGFVPNAGKFKPALRIKNTGGGPGDNAVYADFDVLADTPCIINWRCLGAGDAASYECRVNGEQIGSFAFGATPAAYNRGPASVLGRDNLSLAGLARTNGPGQGPFNCLIGEQIVYGGGLTTEQNRMVEAYLSLWWGIALSGDP